MSTVLKTQNLTKSYGSNKGANDINITISAGEVVGFIGPNGAGKTTALKLLTKLIFPDKGKLYLFDKEITSLADYLKVSNSIGFMPSEGGLYENLKVKDFLQLSANLYGLKSHENSLELATELKLDLNTEIKKLSFGNKRKAALIQAVMHNPKLTILDEPTAGLDPLVQKQVLDLIKNMKDKGDSVLLSSHNLAEVQSICDRIIMIKDSRIIFDGTTKEILKESVRRFIIEDMPVKLKPLLEKSKFVKSFTLDNDDAIVYVTDYKEMIDFLIKNSVYNFFIEKPSLEETFINYY